MFVMDVQTHHLDLELARATEICNALDFRELAASLGAKPSDVDCPEKLGQLNFVKEVLVDSQTSVAVLSGVPNGVILGPDLMFRTRDLVNDLAQSERAIMQAMIDPKRPPGTPTSIETLERQVNELGARALKVYTYNGNWRLDDETVAYPMLEEVQRLGLRLVNVHKGLATLFGQNPEYVRATDFPKVVADWPQLRFCAYHAGYFFRASIRKGKRASRSSSRWSRECRASTRSASTPRSAARSSPRSFSTDPMAPAHLMGQLLKTFGSKRILWGTDSMWWGSPQFAIDAFKNLQIPESMQEEFGYPALTEKRKQRILGLNAAALYGVKPREERCSIAPDRIEQTQTALGGFREDRSLRRTGRGRGASSWRCSGSGRPLPSHLHDRVERVLRERLHRQPRLRMSAMSFSAGTPLIASSVTGFFSGSTGFRSTTTQRSSFLSGYASRATSAMPTTSCPTTEW
jgi:predicted TIM-barrel fold metal-dependent hydrolase